MMFDEHDIEEIPVKETAIDLHSLPSVLTGTPRVVRSQAVSALGG